MEIPNTPIRYRLDVSGAKSRELGVGMTVDLPLDEPLDVVMPHFSPGSPTKSAGHDDRISGLAVQDATGKPLGIAKNDDGSFNIIRNAPGPVTVHYTVQADEFSHVRNSVTEEHAYISGAAAMMYVKGRDQDTPSIVELTNLPKSNWSSISNLAEIPTIPHAFWANSYKDIADSNTFAGELRSVEAQSGDTKLVVNVHGENPWEQSGVKGVTADETLADLTAAYEVFTKNFGEFPLERIRGAAPRPAGVEQQDKYVLNKHYVQGGNGYSGGFEHYHGHELILNEKAGSTIEKRFGSDARTYERGILVHELVHKMLAKFVTHAGIDSEDLSRVVVGDGLWVTEGVTDWTGTVLERQAGMLNGDQYKTILEGFYDRYQRNMAKRPTSPTEDSREAHLGNSNYYNKGAVAASLLDLEIRHYTDNQRGFFDVIRDLKDEFGGTGRGHTLDDMERLSLNQVKGNPDGEARVREFYQKHLRGQEPMEIDRSLALVGLQLEAETGEKEQQVKYRLAPIDAPTGQQLALRQPWEQAKLLQP
jgi:predicted metalloprotease with PDZ domain